jgi:hypothetical protein
MDFKAVRTDKPGFFNIKETKSRYLTFNSKLNSGCFLSILNKADLTVGGGKKL